MRHATRALGMILVLGVAGSGCVGGPLSATLGGWTVHGPPAAPVRAAREFLEKSAALRSVVGGAPRFSGGILTRQASEPGIWTVGTHVELQDRLGEVQVRMAQAADGAWEVQSAHLVDGGSVVSLSR